MLMLILCALLAVAGSRPAELQNDAVSGRLTGMSNFCPNKTAYAKRGAKSGAVRFEFCWKTSDYENEKVIAEDAAKVWERVANLTIEFNGECDEEEDAWDVIPIEVSDVRPFVTSTYINCWYKPTLVVLNFEFDTPGFTKCHKPPLNVTNCIKFTAMHEMGHALGFVHEQNHPDSSCAKDRDRGIYKSETAYDPDSIMNYCNTKVWLDPQLSKLDIEGVQKVYGVRK